MDQDGFRALLASSGSRAPAAAAAAAPSRAFGAKPRRFAAGTGPREPAAEAEQEQVFKPRKSFKDAKGKGADKGKEKEKAHADGRAGERRGDIGADGQASTSLRQQLSSDRNGDDGRQAMPFKGLDMAELQRRRAELAHGGGADESVGPVTDDDLEAALSRQPDALPQSTGSGSRKRTRDDMVAELKAKREDELRATGKFRPINKPVVQTKPKAVDQAAVDKEQEARRERKRRRKEKRKAEKAALEHNGGTMEAEPSVAREVLEAPTEQHAATAEAEPAGPAPEPVDEEDDVDIFADAGEYKGLDDSDASDAGAAVPEDADAAVARARDLARGKKTWFADDEPEADEGPKEAGAGQPVPPPERHESEPRSRSASPDPPAATAEPTSSRLVGLSGSSDIHTLLALDEEAARAERKTARKNKGKGAKEGVGRELSAAERANRDLQRLQNYQKRK